MEPFERDVKESLQFLTRYDWIHNFQVTRILKDKILSKIPIEWFSHLQDLDTQEINDLPFMESSSPEKFPAWPASLHSFLAEAAALSLARTQIQNISPTVVDAEMVRGMNPKKLHEVSWMASFVHDAACRADCNLIVDIGSGLGYLDHVLHQVYGHPVLGLETSESHLSAAESRAVKQGLTCGGVKSLKFNIIDSEECFKALERILDDFSLICQCNHTIKGDECKSDSVRGSESVRPTTATVVCKELSDEARNLCLTNATKGDLCCSTASDVSSPRVCLIGLHCCGDLSTSALAMFHHLNCIKAVCCVSCCYHKMAYSDDCFMKFPLSSAGQKHYQEIRSSHTSCLLSPFTFRLGAQETRCRWRTQSQKEHSDHIRHVAFRGLLEMTVSTSCRPACDRNTDIQGQTSVAQREGLLAAGDCANF